MKIVSFGGLAVLGRGWRRRHSGWLVGGGGAFAALGFPHPALLGLISTHSSLNSRTSDWSLHRKGLSFQRRGGHKMQVWLDCQSVHVRKCRSNSRKDGTRRPEVIEDERVAHGGYKPAAVGGPPRALPIKSFTGPIETGPRGGHLPRSKAATHCIFCTYLSKPASGGALVSVFHMCTGKGD